MRTAAVRRCAATASAAWQKYVYDKGLTDKKDITIVSAGKIKYLKLTVEGKTATDRGQVTLVQVNMGNPILAPAEVPVTVEATQETADGPAVVNASHHGRRHGIPHDMCIHGQSPMPLYL